MKMIPSTYYLKLWISSRIHMGMPPQLVTAELRRRLKPADTESSELARQRHREAMELIERVERGEE